MDIIFQNAFKFDMVNNRVIPVPIPDENTDFDEYIGDLIADVVGDVRSKKYLFPGESTTTMNDIREIVNGENKDAAARRFARRLLTEEIRVQGRIAHLNREVQRGIMIQTLVDIADVKHFLIIKAEHFDFIDEGSTRKATGLPIRKKIFKSFCTYFDEGDNLLYAMVSDNKTMISTYWWREFLELVQEHTDEHNTETSFDILDRKIFKPMQEKWPRDYMYLRNATITYYRTNQEFVLEDYLRAIISPYVPDGEGLNTENMANRIRKLPESWNFNSRFNIIRSKLTKRIITKLRLTAQLDLVIKEDINWDNSVQAVTEDGVKYIKIRSDYGFNYFKKAE